MARRSIKVKPGKGGSKIGFIAGLLFVLLGIFVVIPAFGLFGLIWTAMAGLICFANFRNGFTDKGLTTHEIIIDDEQLQGMSIEDTGDKVRYNAGGSAGYNTAVSAGGSAGEDIEAKLVKLNSLYDQQLITKEEYDEKRKEFLKEF